MLETAAKVAVLVFVVSSMLAMGVCLTVKQIITPLQNPRLIVLALVGNFVLMPLGAVILSTVLRRRYRRVNIHRTKYYPASRARSGIFPCRQTPAAGPVRFAKDAAQVVADLPAHLKEIHEIARACGALDFKLSP